MRLTSEMIFSVLRLTGMIFWLESGEKRWLANFTGYYLLAGVLMVGVLHLQM
jgi:hypothetical protein